MSTFSPPQAPARLALTWATALVWLLAAAGLVFWVLQWPSPDAMLHTANMASPQPHSSTPNAMLAKALGQTQARIETSAPRSSQFNLIGVMASPSGQGTALIAIDGQAAQIFRVGQTVHEGWTLDTVSTRQARLTSSGAQVVLDMPSLDKN